MTEMLFDPKRASEAMERDGLDALVACRRENVAYLSGVPVHYWRWGRFMHMLFLEDAGDRAHYYAGIQRDSLQEPFIVAHYSRVGDFAPSWVKDVRPCSLIERYSPHPIKVLSEALLERLGPDARVGMELSVLPANDLTHLKAMAPSVEVVDSTNVFWELRAVKTDAELSRMRTAYRVAEKVYDRVFAEIEPGMTLRDIYRMEMDEVLAHDCFFLGQHLSFGSTCDGTHHGEPDYVVRLGDVGFFDLQVVFEGYLTDFGRVPVVGEVSEEYQSLHDEIVQARSVAESALAPGCIAGEVAECVRRYGSSLRPQWLPDGAGHGLGMECHEPPFLRTYSDSVIEEGMVVVIEICRALRGVAMLIEDAGVVEDDGWHSLTDYPTDLVFTGH